MMGYDPVVTLNLVCFYTWFARASSLHRKTLPSVLSACSPQTFGGKLSYTTTRGSCSYLCFAPYVTGQALDTARHFVYLCFAPYLMGQALYTTKRGSCPHICIAPYVMGQALHNTWLLLLSLFRSGRSGASSLHHAVLGYICVSLQTFGASSVGTPQQARHTTVPPPCSGSPIRPAFP